MKAFKKQAAGNPLLKLRKRLGITQQQFADQLGLSRSLVMMIEQGKRSLPTAVLLRVAEMEIKLASKDEISLTGRLHHSESPLTEKCNRSCSFLSSRASSCRVAAMKLTARLNIMLGLYQKTREWLHVIESSLEEDTKPDERIKTWWLRQQLLAQRTLENCSMQEQVLLRHKISLMESQADLFAAKHEALKLELTKLS